jgi:Domain of unknown function (DUF4126)
MCLFFDIGTGAGLAGATGVRPFLPPLLAGTLARGDAGIDFDGTDWSFLESPGFLFGLLVLVVLAYAAERSGSNRAPPAGDRPALAVAEGVIGLVLGALLFAGAMADGGEEGWIGLVAGPVCAALGWLAVGGLLDRARARLQGGAATLLGVYAEVAALLIAAAAIFLPPVSYLVLVAFVVLLFGGRRREGQKYAGLRVLR